MKKLIAVLVLVAIALVAAFDYSRYIREQIYIGAGVPERPAPGTVLVQVESQGRMASGLLIPRGPTLVVVLHGNGSNAERELEFVQRFVARKDTVLIPEYPGYGISRDYDAREEAIYDDVEAVIRDVQKQSGFAPENTKIVGISLGGGVAVELAQRGLAGKLVLLSTFSSVDDMLALYGPKLIASLLNTEKFDNVAKAPSIDIDTLIVHGDNDDLVPYYMAEELHAAFPNSTLVPYVNTQHASLRSDLDEDTWGQILAFGAAQVAAARPEPCSSDWLVFVEEKVQTGDEHGHGPDFGSEEWRSVVEFKLGIRDDPANPPSDSREWCGFIDGLIQD